MSFAILKAGSTVPPVRARRGDFEDWFRAGLELAEEEVRLVRASEGEPLPDPATLAGAVVTGSQSMVTEEAPWSLELERWLARAVEVGTPLLAVCYGHQALARALGGEAGWNPSGREIGTVEVELTPAARADPLFAALPARCTVQSSHSQSVTRLPPGARLLAGNAKDPHQAFAVGTSAWSVQFHPEFDEDIVRGYLEHRREAIASEGADVDALLEATRETPECRSLLRRFRELAAALARR